MREPPRQDAGTGEREVEAPHTAADRLRKLIQSAPLAIYTRDPDGLITSWNLAAERMFGWAESEVLGKPLPSVPHADRGVSDGLRARLLTGETFRHETVRRRRDGSTIDIDAFIGPLRDDAGHVEGIIAIVADITDRKRAEAALRERERFVTTLMSNLPGMVYRCLNDENWTMTFVSAGCETLTGYEPFELQDAQAISFGDLVHPDDRDWLWRSCQASLDARLPCDNQYRLIVRSGETRWVWDRASGIYAADGTLLSIEGFIQDVTERKQAEAALRESAAQMRLFADNVPVMSVVYDDNLRCRFANRPFAEFFGLTTTSIVGRHLREIAGDESYEDIRVYFERVLAGDPTTYERTRTLDDGTQQHVEVRLVPDIAGDGKVRGLFAVAADITERKEIEDRIRILAHHDALTGLPNRLLFNDRLSQAIRTAKRESRELALLYLDLDDFKPVNDLFGHEAGDELLKRVATRICDQVRDSDTVARMGGDEFVIMLPDIAAHTSVSGIAEKLVAALARPFYLESQEQHVEIGASIGIAIYPGDGEELDSLVKAADSAMYDAKQSGGCARLWSDSESARSP